MRILIAGLGAVGQRHARNLRTLYGRDVELLAYRQRHLRHVVTETLHSDTTRDVEAEFGITAFSSLEMGLERRPDAVFVCTPSSQHLDIARRAAAAGCHLFIEKPVSHNLDGLEELRHTVEVKGLVAAVGCQWRYHPGVRALRGRILDGAFGAIRGADIDYAEYLPAWHPYEDYRQSYAARSALGGGVILTQIHDYDLAWWLFGQPRSVTATGGHLSDLEIDVEDTVDAKLDTPRCRVRVRQSFASASRRRTISVFGERSSTALDLFGIATSANSPSASSTALQGYQRNQLFLDEVRQFVDSFRDGALPGVPLDEGIAVLRLALAVRESLRGGMEVSLS